MRLNILVKDVMNKDVKIVKSNDPIKKAANIMKRNKIGSVLVIDENGVQGILTEIDIVYKYVAQNKGKKTKDIMTKKLVKISPQKSIEEASRLMVAKGIEKLPVVDKNDVVGIITSTDILKVEPALFEILLEKMKIGSERIPKEYEIQFSECEICGNYSDDVEEVNGVYTCGECRP